MKIHLSRLALIAMINGLIDLVIAGYLFIFAFTQTGTDSGFITGPAILFALGLVADAAVLGYLSLKRRHDFSVYYVISRMLTLLVWGLYELFTLLSDTSLYTAFSIGYTTAFVGAAVLFSASTYLAARITKTARRASLGLYALSIIMVVAVLLSLRVDVRAASTDPGSGLAGSLRDQHTEQSLHIVENAFNSYFVENNILPGSIAQVGLTSYDQARVTKDNVTYEQKGTDSYQLCATFFTESTRRIYPHKSGYDCVPFSYQSLSPAAQNQQYADPDTSTQNGGASLQYMAP